MMVLCLPGFPVFIGTPFLLIRASAAGNDWPVLETVVFYVLAVAVLGAIASGAVVLLISAEWLVVWLRSAVVAVLVGAGLTLYVNSDAWLLDPALRVALQAALIALGINYGIAIVLLPLLILGIYALMRALYSADPPALICCSLLETATALIGEAGHEWTDLKWKVAVCDRFETVARQFEGALPKKLHTGDRTTDLRTTRAGREMAAGIRQLKMAIMTPMPSTRSWLRSRITNDLRHMLEGNWDSMQHIPTDEWQWLTRRDLVVAFSSRLWSAVIGAASPLAVLWFLQSQKLLEGAAAAWAPAAALGIAALSIMAAFDPLFVAKIGAVKEVGSLVKPFGGGSK
jgi:hypothetical protein